MNYKTAERARATAWKSATATLPDAAKVPARYVDKDGADRGERLPFCLPRKHADLSLLPEVRDDALALFEELAIPWHAGTERGPSNHLLSSQVQCVNALGQMVRDGERLRRAFADVLDTDEALEVEPGRYLTFEFIGPHDYFGENSSGLRRRGAHATSVDAAFLHRTKAGAVELVLLEWKYTEQYTARTPDPRKDEERRRRYQSAWLDPEGPFAGPVALDVVLDEPLYQLVRQQLLAHALEPDHVLGADVARVVHVCPPENLAYEQSLQPAQRALGDTVSEVWARLLRRPDRFTKLDPQLFADQRITSAEYVLRYGVDVAHDVDSLLVAAQVDDIDDVADRRLYEDGFDGDVHAEDRGVELYLGGRATFLDFPFTLRSLREAAADLQAELEAVSGD
jgi:hypothetical protein